MSKIQEVFPFGLSLAQFIHAEEVAGILGTPDPDSTVANWRQLVKKCIWKNSFLRISLGCSQLEASREEK
jgi:hypothetical protein